MKTEVLPLFRTKALNIGILAGHKLFLFCPVEKWKALNKGILAGQKHRAKPQGKTRLNPRFFERQNSRVKKLFFTGKKGGKRFMSTLIIMA